MLKNYWLNEIEDREYFREKLFKPLNFPGRNVFYVDVPKGITGDEFVARLKKILKENHARA